MYKASHDVEALSVCRTACAAGLCLFQLVVTSGCHEHALGTLKPDGSGPMDAGEPTHDGQVFGHPERTPSQAPRSNKLLPVPEGPPHPIVQAVPGELRAGSPGRGANADRAPGPAMPSSPPAAVVGPAAGVSAQAPAQPASWSTAFALLAAGGGLDAVLGTVEGTDVTHRPPRLFDRRSGIVHAGISHHDLPAYARGWRARSVEVVTDQAVRCAATVFGFDYRVDLISDDYEQDRWNGISDDPEEQLRPLRGRALAKAIWEASATRSVTARLRLDDPASCRGEPLYVRDTTHPPAQVARKLASIPRRAAVLEAFRSLPAYREAQAQYASSVSDRAPSEGELPRRWEEDYRQLTMQAFAFDDADRVLVSIAVPWTGCRDWDPSLWAVFWVQVAGVEPPALADLSTSIAPHQVHLILKRNTAGLVYVIEEDRPAGRSMVHDGQRLTSWLPEFHGCRC